MAYLSPQKIKLRLGFAWPPYYHFTFYTASAKCWTYTYYLH